MQPILDDHQILEKHIGLIEHKANFLKQRYSSLPLEKDDLVSEGVLGLVSAVRGYDPEKGEFHAFLSACVENKMRSFIRKVRASEAKHASSVNIDFAAPNDFPSAGSAGNSGVSDNFGIRLAVADKSVAIEADNERKESERELFALVENVLSPLEYRAMLLYICGYTYREISMICKISEKAVDNALARSKSKLKRIFK